MDKNRLERFARHARRYLLRQTENKLIQILVYKDGKESDQRRAYPQRVKALEDEIFERYSIRIEPGATTIATHKMAELIDTVAYTWFNRFCALRYMDLNRYNQIGVVSPLPGHFQPEILEEAKAGYIDEKMVPAQDRNRVFALLNGTQTHPDPQHEAYRVLVRAVSNYYALVLPFLFDPIAKWKELLMPDDLLSGESILSYTREAMTPRACRDVEVIGWLYQYYISEKKSEVQAAIKKGKKLLSDEIPAVTQLFTPDWIVRYMVENSLGRLWMNNRPNSSLKNKMEYYIEDDQENAANEQSFCRLNSPEEIRFCDPCCGSGHILTYAFDLLYSIYDEEGYDHNSIPALILKNNLYGIEIDGRASELAALALSMKAREQDPLWFSKRIEPNICRLQNIKFAEDEIKPYFQEIGHDIFTFNFERMLDQFEDAKTFGSLIVPYEQDIQGIKELLDEKDFEADVFLAPVHQKIKKLIKQADYLSTKYQVVVTNPPYLGTGNFSKEKADWFRKYYPISRTDYFAMFMERCLSLSLKNGFASMINMQGWMFLSSYQKLREHLVTQYEFISMAHLGPRAFDSIGGEVVSTTAFIIQNSKPGNKKGAYFRLIEGRSETEKRDAYLEAIANPNCGWLYHYMTSDFHRIPGTPIAYWVPSSFMPALSSPPLSTLVNLCASQNKTANNAKYLRRWYEIEFKKISLKWVFYSKGGEYRKYYGNNEWVINWSEKARHFYRNNPTSNLLNENYWYREGITYTDITTKGFNARYVYNGFVYDMSGPTMHPLSKKTAILALLNSKPITYFLNIVNPTMHNQARDVKSIPVPPVILNEFNENSCLLTLAKLDWDSYEISWDFQTLPLMTFKNEVLSIQEAYQRLRESWKVDTLKMQILEEENNRIFIEAYGLEGELSPEVPLKEITLTCNPYYRYKVDAESALGVRGEAAAELPLGVRSQGLGVSDDSGEGLKPKTYNLKPNNALKPKTYKLTPQFPINEDLEKRLLADTMKELISYGVGCMFGRYSLDKPGLILANSGENLDDYLSRVPQPSFMPNKNNVIPILDEQWFAEDIVNLFSEFLKAAFGHENFQQNLQFIEKVIDKELRRYFLRDFYKDHVKMYKNRPIYWLFSSPKGSFNALIYLHRYTPDTASIVLNDYLREYVFKLNNRLVDLRNIEISADSSPREKTQASKEIDKLESIVSELEYWERDALYPLAAKRVQIDLDDGVKANYALFEGVLKGVRF